MPEAKSGLLRRLECQAIPKKIYDSLVFRSSVFEDESDAGKAT
jgi:hypothetical protein